MIRELVEQLRNEQSVLSGQVKELERSLREKKAELKQVSGALRELNGRKPRKPAGQGGVTTEVVAGLIEEALAGGPLTSEELKQAVEARLNGQPRTGLHLRLKDALESERFRLRDGRWELTAVPQRTPS